MRFLRALTAWLPIPALFLTYQLAGWLGRQMARPSADRLLLEWDRALFGVNPGLWLVQSLPLPVLSLFDVFYFSYYVLLIAGPGVAYSRYGTGALWRFWTTAGMGFLICYLLFPWFPSTPPRLLFQEFAYGGAPQAINLWVLNRFSVHGNVFPSAHVAAAFSFASCHLRFNRRVGLSFLVWAAGIGISTVSGGYHYGVDAVGGAVVGLAADWIVSRFARNRRHLKNRLGSEVS